MPRPSAITAFDRLYLASIAVYVIAGLAFWSTTRELALDNPAVQANASIAPLVGPIMAGSLIVTVLISGLLWWLVSRQRSVAGKWLVVVTEALGGLFGLWTLAQLAQGSSPNPAGTALNLVATALAVAAAAMLLRRDAAAWFDDHATMVEPFA